MITSAAIVAVGLLLAAACAGGDSAPAATMTAGFELPQGSTPVALDPTKFTGAIDNRYWPMTPGTRWTYEETDEAGRRVQVVVTVSTETKQIANGITARVVRDTVTADGEMIEDTFDWYAQDADRHLWYLGEETAEFEGGAVTSRAGSWEAGVDGALPGIMVPGRPAPGMRYRQEYYAGEAEDNGEVLSVGEQVDVPAGRYHPALLTRDTTTLHPEIVEYQLYAPEVGPVLVIGISGGSGREVLVSMQQVPEDVARASGTTPLGEPYR